ncbi:MAG: hypothetical protein GX022_09840 [Clostridiaceae bacterium]|nr:hypothetical protein [Clostridiaceae bacterium]
MNNRGIDITRNIRIIESLKSDLLLSVSHLYNEMASETGENLREVALDTLSDTIIISYLLSRRLGIDYPTLERQISAKIRLGLLQEHETEKYFGDLSALSRIRNHIPQAGDAS